MKKTDVSDQAIRLALDKCLSGAEALPSRRGEILRAAKGEMKVKRKMNLGLVLALILVLLTTSVAVAEALGLFGQIGQNAHSDARLPGLENVSTVMDKVFTVDNGVTVTVNQAYYDGSRIFISYKVEGPYDVLETGTGKPDLVNYDQKYDGVIFSDMWYVEGPNGKKLMDWLDGSEPRWAKTTTVNVHDGLQIGDEYLDIIGGEFYYLEDGTLMSWKECIVPEELAADEVTFSIGVFTTGSTYYQTAEALYTFGTERGESTWHDFTVQKAAPGVALTGTAKTVDWTATADLTASAIDVKGTVTLQCPESWVTAIDSWENPDKVDYIQYWALYVDGKPVDGYNLDACIYGKEPLTFGICYKLDALSEDMMLVPEYAYAGEKVDEAIVLQAK